MIQMEDYSLPIPAAGKSTIIDLHLNRICEYLRSFELEHNVPKSFMLTEV